MFTNLRYVLLLGMPLWLTACGGGSSSESSLPPAPEASGDDVAITGIDDPLFNYQWYLNNTGQTALTYYNRSGTAGEDINIYNSGVFAQDFSGDGVRVAVVDTGLDINHQDLLENIVPDASYNFSDNGLGQYDPSFIPNASTAYDHGTAVSGILAARGGNSIGITGVAPSAELRGFNLLVAQDYPNELAALGYQPTLDSNNYDRISSPLVDVFNMSYGRSITYVLPDGQANYYDSLVGAMKWGTQNLRNGKGALYVKAAGNEYAGGWILDKSQCTQAADMGVTCYNTNLERDTTYPFEMVVSAFNADGHKSSFSNTGSSLWLSGPGGEFGVYSPAILSTDQSGCSAGYSQIDGGAGFTDFDKGETQENLNCDYYSAFNATSAATPAVSGSIALLLEANPDLHWRDVKHILATTARKIDDSYDAVTMSLNGQTVTLENNWVSNDAGYHFSNAFGFGAVDVDEALSMATNGYSLLAEQKEINKAGSVTNSGEIPDADATGISESLLLNQNGNPIVESVQLSVSLKGVDGRSNGNSNFDFSDYQIILQSPSGTQSIVMTPFHAFDKQYAISNFPMQTHAFYGEELNGSWTLMVRDLDSQSDLTGEGKLVNWSLKFYVRDS